MAKLTFDNLSEDVKALIVDRILRPTDLKNVCLVNKQLHALAIKPLYRHVALDLGSAKDTRLSAFLSPHNAGLKHIRQLRLHLAKVRDSCNQKQHAGFATRLVLDFLPGDVLEEFSWCPWEPFSADNLLLLYQKQRRIKRLEVMNLDRDVLPAIKKSAQIQETLFSCAKTLALYPENRQMLDLSHHFVERTAELLEELIVHAEFLWPEQRENSRPLPTEQAIDTRELNDSATGPGLLTRTVFSHMMPFETCTPFKKLTSLRLHFVGLRHCADTWCRFIDFTLIQDLRLYHCSGADSLFGQLCKASHLPKRLRSLDLHHKDNDENEALIALDGFLCLVSGIQELIINVKHVKSLPAAAGIARHGKTLQMLSVHASAESPSPLVHVTPPENDAEELVWETEELEKICKACTQLEQLSCAWPLSSLIRTPNELWKAYENAVFSSLKDLVTLHITTFPNNKPSTQLLPKTIYEQLLQCLATRLFDLAAGGSAQSTDTTSTPSSNNGDDPPGPNPPPIPPDGSAPTATPILPNRSKKLRLIAFGISDKIYEREDSKNQLLYLRSTSLSAFGEEKVHAAPIGWCLRQYVEPRSDVLDVVLHRDTKGPWKYGNEALGLSWGEGVDDE
ncbi:hypothetical protein LTR54_006223 [Friedmanniomyces endolithicus]|nr:hypothetical protein LTR54_006223 [Friedmanniomyces endolithicus]